MMRFLPLVAVWVGALVLAPLSHAGAPPSAKPREASAKDILSTGKPIYSHSNEELIIRDFFRDCRGGVFLDVGCGHPIDASNTYFLEKHLGWSGIGVDALPEMARKWRRLRPASKFANYIVTDHAGALEPFYRVELSARDISSIEKPVLDPGGGPVQSEEILVSTITLTKLLDDEGVSKIDFLSMDIEGAEPLALAGFDVERFKPELACVEAKVRNRERILKYFADHGYHRIDRYLEYDQVNWYFTPNARDR